MANQTNNHILIIDDDIELTEMLASYLSGAGYSVTVENHPVKGLSRACEDDSVELVLLDVMMPELDGFEVLKKLRASRITPVIMLTARGDDYDKILGLELGADDYLPKPFNHRELEARVKAIFRRQALTSQSGLQQNMAVNGIALSASKQQATCHGHELTLTSTEFLILRLLMLHAGHLVSKDDISLKVLEKPLATFDRSIDMHVSNLRRKIAEFAEDEKIRTIRGAGYLLKTAS